MKNKYIRCSLFVTLLIIIDQLSKYFIVKYIDINDSIILIKNFFEFTFITNKGAALGFLSNNLVLLILISMILVWYIIKEIKGNIKNKITLLSLSLILSGALGNLIDRIFRGYVVDFISFKLFNHYMPIFNIADISITFGVIILIWITMKEENKHDKKNRRK